MQHYDRFQATARHCGAEGQCSVNSRNAPSHRVNTALLTLCANFNEHSCNIEKIGPNIFKENRKTFSKFKKSISIPYDPGQRRVLQLVLYNIRYYIILYHIIWDRYYEEVRGWTKQFDYLFQLYLQIATKSQTWHVISSYFFTKANVHNNNNNNDVYVFIFQNPYISYLQSLQFRVHTHNFTK
jgi:hypothetical protein